MLTFRVGRVVSVILISFIATVASAQDITKGSLGGVVRDSSGAVVPGVTVTLTSSSGDRTTQTDSNGTYTFLNVAPATDYVVTVNQPGFQVSKVNSLTVRVNAQTTADISLQVGQNTQTVDVEGGATQSIDLSSTKTGAVLDSALYTNTAIGRNITSVINMSPGVSDSGGAGAANPSINGASGLENQYIVNGSNITDPGFGGFGSYSRTFGPKGTGVNFDFIQEVQVIAGGFEAEYGQALGGVVNVITKSGSNDFHGSAYGYFAPAAFQKNEPNPNAVLVDKVTYERNNEAYDFGGDFGGHIIKDKLFFYGGINPIFNNSYQQADRSFANSALGIVNVSSQTINYTGKINWNLSSKHQLEGSVFGDPSTTPTTFNRGLNSNDNLRTSALDYGTRTWTGRYTGTLSNNWIVTANYSEYSNHFGETPAFDGIEATDNVPVEENTGSAFTYNGLGFLENTDSHTHQFAASTSLIGNFFGQHTLQIGYQFEDDPYNDTRLYTGGDVQLPTDPSLGAASGQILHGAAVTRTHLDPNDLTSPIYEEITAGNYSNPVVTTDTRYNSGFVEDTWTIGNRLTLKPGLRFEQQALNGTGARYVFAHNWAPRIGFILDPTANRHTKFFGNWGRFYEKVPLDIAVRSLSIESGVAGQIYYNDSGSNQAPNLDPTNFVAVPGNVAQVTGAVPTIVAGGTGAEYQDEVVGGYEHQFSDRFTFSGRFVYRHLRRIIEDEQGVNATQGYDAGEFGYDIPYVIGNPSAKQDDFVNQTRCSTPTGESDASCIDGWTPPFLGGDGIPDGFPNPSRIYKSMELIVSRRFGSNFQLYANYVLSKLYGNFQGSFRGDNQQTDPNISSLFDFTNTDGVLTDQFQPGVLPTDRTHQLKIFGNYAWRGVNFGLSWNIQSGVPISKLLDHPVYLNAGEVPSGGRGSLGRSDWSFPVDLHADYTWKLGEKTRMKFAGDVFNVGNRIIVYRPNQDYEVDSSPGLVNPDFLKPQTIYYSQSGYSAPFYARLSARFEF